MKSVWKGGNRGGRERVRGGKSPLQALTHRCLLCLAHSRSPQPGLLRNVPGKGRRGGGETFLIGAGSYYSGSVDM